MLKLNPRYVYFVHLRHGTKEGTHTIIVEGTNDRHERYEITLRGIGGPDCSEQETRVIRHVQDLQALGPSAHISHKYHILLAICDFVGDFFERRKVEEREE